MKKLTLILIFILIPFSTFGAEIYKVSSVVSYSVENYLDTTDVKDRSYFIKSLIPNLVHRIYFLNYSYNESSLVLDKKSEFIKSKIISDNPNIVTTYGSIAFEYFQLNKLFKYGITIPSIFFCVPDYMFMDFNQKFNFSSDLIKGTVQRTNIYDLFVFIQSRELFIENVTLIVNRKSSSNQLATYISNSVDKTKYNFNTVKIENTSELKVVLKQQKEHTLIIYGMQNLFDQNGKEVSDFELAKIIEKYNKKNLEVSLVKNLSRYGVAMSYVPFHGQGSLDKKDSPCNVILYSIYTNKPLNNNIVINDIKIVVNHDRVYELNFSNILSSTTDIFTVY